jgi:cytochrome c5
MKKIAYRSLVNAAILTVVLLFVNFSAKAQDNTKLVASFPDNVNKIFSTSCTPCHTDKGGTMSKSKLNFSAWEKYSPEKQKEKAKKIYAELDKGKMPPKAAREKRPDLIPSAEQVEVIKNWSETYSASK